MDFIADNAVARCILSVGGFLMALIYRIGGGRFIPWIQRIGARLRPFFCSDQAKFLAFLIVFWVFLLVAINWNGMTTTTILSRPIVTFEAGLLSFQSTVLSIPDLINALSPNSQDYSDSVSSSSSSSSPIVDSDDVIKKYLKSAEFEAKLRLVALEHLRPWKEEIMADSEAKLDQIKTDFRAQLQAKDALAAQDLASKFNAFNLDIEQKLNERLNTEHVRMRTDLEDKLKRLNDERSQLEKKVQKDRNVQDVKGEERISNLETKIQNVEYQLQDVEHQILKCCGKPVVSSSKSHEMISSFVQALLQNSSDDSSAQKLNTWLYANYLPKEEWHRDVQVLQGTLKSELRSELMSLAEMEARKTASAYAEGILSNMTLEKRVDAEVNKPVTVDVTVPNAIASEDDIIRIINQELRKYDADKTGMFDFALESAGGTIASTRCTETHDLSTAIYSMFGIPFWWTRNNPRAILQPESSPGQCWAFKGSYGTVVVKLSSEIFPKAISLEHIAKMIAPEENISSAPKKFAVFGLTHVDDENPVSLGNFTYSDSATPVQTFFLADQSRAFQYVELKILSNYGHMVYTCLYRFRVHGKLVTDS